MCTFVSGLPITVLFPGQVGRGFSLVKPGFLQAALLIRKAIRGYKYCNGILQRQVQSLYSNHSRIWDFDADIGFCNLLLLMEDLVFGIVLRTGNSC
jgi:hypothetical protein